jgi:hypothetical protein
MIHTTCDTDGCRSKGFETIHCDDCFSDLESQLNKAKERIAELES